MVLNNNKIKADLIWVFSSPNLLNEQFGDDFFTNQFTLAHFKALVLHDNRPINLKQFRINRLGFYFEDLVFFGLQYFPHLKIIAKNQVISNNNKTIGEFDLIVQNIHTLAYFHFELAVKFYIGTKPLNQLASWVGPNKSDKFKTKFDKLLKTQLQLARSNEAEIFLKQNNIKLSQSKLFVKGVLFYPLDEGNTVYPAEVNPSHLKSWWCYPNQFKSVFANHLNFTLVPKLNWFNFTQNSLKIDKILTLNQLLTYSKNQPQMVAVLQQTPNGMVESTKGFLVPQNWI